MARRICAHTQTSPRRRYATSGHVGAAPCQLIDVAMHTAPRTDACLSSRRAHPNMRATQGELLLRIIHEMALWGNRVGGMGRFPASQIESSQAYAATEMF
mmetsp:Transcript_22721/g.51897  ORF Transcript_22721/g.51897 Transcript_22721/m.51897 type:complete len:100 (-) Transcript_22721:71-370(-)